MRALWTGLLLVALLHSPDLPAQAAPPVGGPAASCLLTDIPSPRVIDGLGPTPVIPYYNFCDSWLVVRIAWSNGQSTEYLLAPRLQGYHRFVCDYRRDAPACTGLHARLAPFGGNDLQESFGIAAPGRIIALTPLTQDLSEVARSFFDAPSVPKPVSPGGAIQFPARQPLPSGSSGEGRNIPAATAAPGPARPPATMASARVGAPVADSAPPSGPLAAMGAGGIFRECPECPEMVVVPAGQFVMGSPESEPARRSDGERQRKVVISAPFAIGRFEVTFDEWDACVREGGCGYTPPDSRWGRGRRPVTSVSWQDAKAYAEWLSRKTGKRYRLPSEAEWEYAARAGTTTPFHTGQTIRPDQANYDSTRTYAGGVSGEWRRQTVEVGSFSPNAFGLFDVHGNASEWTEDCVNEGFLARFGAPVDGSAWLSGDCTRRMQRGGDWVQHPMFLRSAYGTASGVSERHNNFGFRLVRTD